MEEVDFKSFKDVEKKLKELNDDKQKKELLKKIYSDNKYPNIRKDVTKKLVNDFILKDVKKSYFLSYDSLSEGIEPIYFWILDFMQDSGPASLGLKVRKFSEDMEASISSGYFGEIGQRTSLMQQKAMEYLGTINNLIKSILNLIYDLKEFELRLEPYDKLNNNNASVLDRDSAVKSLKGIWMDQVDARKGRGSINLLAQDLNFVTLRDAFFAINSIDSIANIDLNSRVKNLLERKLNEYFKWVEVSEQEIRTRYNIEKRYLKSQKATLSMYADWVKPYLKAAQKLKMKEFNSAHIVNAFSNMEFEIKLHGKKEITPGSVHESYKDVSLDRKYFSVIEVIMHFRSVPSVMSGQGGRHYVHSGRTDLTINAFSMDDTDLRAVESMELYENLDLIEDYVGGSLQDINSEIEKYLAPEKPKDEVKDEKKKPKTLWVNPFAGVSESFKNMLSPMGYSIGSKSHNKFSFVDEDIQKIATEDAQKKAYTIYNVYKKTHGMANI